MYPRGLIKRRILVFGAGGRIGSRILRHFAGRSDVELLAVSSEPPGSNPYYDTAEVDLTSRADTKKIIRDFFPDVIINAAGLTDPQRCEIERETAWKLNVRAVEHMAESARVIDAKIIHLSCDFIFDGRKGHYTEIDKPNPRCYYGRTKLASENALRISGTRYGILRTNLIFGAPDEGRPDFVRDILEQLEKGFKIELPADDLISPIYISDLLMAVEQMIGINRIGLYHIAGRSFLSSFEFGRKIAENFDYDPGSIIPVESTFTEGGDEPPRYAGLVTVKAETELGFKPLSLDRAIQLFKAQLHNTIHFTF